MKNKASLWCYITGVINYIAGIIYCFSLIFIPIGIYSIIYGMKYFRVAKLTDSELSMARPFLFGPTIGSCIFAFPIGLISLVVYFMAGANNVKVVSTSSAFREEPAEGETVKVNVDTVTIQKETDKSDELNGEDLEKLEKLANFKKQGLLTDEEYEQAKNQLINKK